MRDSRKVPRSSCPTGGPCRRPGETQAKDSGAFTAEMNSECLQPGKGTPTAPDKTKTSQRTARQDQCKSNKTRQDRTESSCPGALEAGRCSTPAHSGQGLPQPTACRRRGRSQSTAKHRSQQPKRDREGPRVEEHSRSQPVCPRWGERVGC